MTTEFLAFVIFTSICGSLLVHAIIIGLDGGDKEKETERIIRHLKILDKLDRSK